MKLVVIESPYASKPYTHYTASMRTRAQRFDIEENLRYVRAAMRDCLLRGEAPFALHALYTQVGVLYDEIPNERRIGIEAGFAWRACARTILFYVDRGWSPGMLQALERAQNDARGITLDIRTRTLGAPWSDAVASDAAYVR